MPYNFKEQKDKYLKTLMNRNEYKKDRQNALKYIIAMMWQAGVDDFNDLPDEPTNINPTILAAELNAVTPLDKMVQAINLSKVEPFNPDTVNTLFKQFKEHKKMQEPEIIEQENVRREMHNRGILTPGMIKAAKEYVRNPDRKPSRVYDTNVEWNEGELESLTDFYKSYTVLTDLLPYKDAFLKDNKEYAAFYDGANDYTDGDSVDLLKNPKELVKNWNAFNSLPDWLDKKGTNIGSTLKAINLFDGPETMTLYDHMYAESRSHSSVKKDVDLDKLLKKAGIPEPESAQKLRERKQALEEKNEEARKEIAENHWLPVADVRKRLDEDVKTNPNHPITESLSTLWNHVDSDKFPEHMRKPIEETKNLAMWITFKAYANTLIPNDTAMLDLYKKTVTDLPNLMATEIETPEQYREKYGEKMTYMTYFREECKNTIFGIGVEVFDKAVKDIESFYGIKLDLSKAYEISDREMLEATPEYKQQQAEAAWAKESMKQHLHGETNRVNDDALLLNEKSREFNQNKSDVAEIGGQIHTAFSDFPDQMQERKGFFGTKNRSLQPLKGMIEELTAMTADGQLNDDEKGVQIVDKLFTIHEEAKRISELKKTKNDPDRNRMINNILKFTSEALSDKRLAKSLEAYEAQQAAPEAEQSTLSDEFIKAKQHQLLLMPKASDCKTKAEAEAYKEQLQQQLAEVLAAQMLVKAVKSWMSDQEQLNVLNTQVKNCAADIMKHDAFKHMMQSAELSPQALDQLREKGASGKQLIDELNRHSKLVQLKAAKASKAAPEKQAEAGMNIM